MIPLDSLVRQKLKLMMIRHFLLRTNLWVFEDLQRISITILKSFWDCCFALDFTSTVNLIKDEICFRYTRWNINISIAVMHQHAAGKSGKGYSRNKKEIVANAHDPCHRLIFNNGRKLKKKITKCPSIAQQFRRRSYKNYTQSLNRWL